MPHGRRKAVPELTEEERATLNRYARRRKTAQSLALRSRIVLACATGAENKEVAEKLDVTEGTVCKWRARFVKDRLAGLNDAPRSGAPRTIDDDAVEQIIVDTLEKTPEGASRWSTRDMAKSAGISHTTVATIWRAFGLKPHRSETFQLSKDPHFIEKVRDVVGLYLSHPRMRSSCRWTRSPRSRP